MKETIYVLLSSWYLWNFTLHSKYYFSFLLCISGVFQVVEGNRLRNQKHHTKQVVLLRIVIFNQGVTIGCQCRSELMVLWWNCWTQIHGPYGQSIEHEDRDKLCCFLYTGNIKNNYLKKLFLLHTHHNMNKSCQYCQLICLLFVFKMNLWICQCYFCLLVTSILNRYLPTSM